MMPINPLAGSPHARRNGRVSGTPTAVQKVAIVNGTPEVLATVEHVLREGHYDVVFIESVAHAYSHIKRVQPDLVIVCVRIDRPDGFHVLNMLKLDPDTRAIPVLTYTAGFDVEEEEDDASGDSGNEETDESVELFGRQSGSWMN